MVESVSEKKNSLVATFVIVLGILLFIGIIVLACIFDDDNKFYGKWEIYSVRYNGSKFSLNELKTMDENTYNKIIDNYFVLKEGGNAYYYHEGNGELVKWEEFEESIKLNDKELQFKNDYLYVSYDENYELYFYRTSRSQSFVDEEDDDDDVLDNGSSDKVNDIEDIESNVIINNDDVKVSTLLARDGNVVLFIKNESNKIYNIESKVKFYNDAHKEVYDEDVYVYAVAPGKEVVTSVDTYGNRKFSSYEVNVDVETAYDMVSYVDKIKFSSRKDEDTIEVQLSNNSGVNLDTISVSVVYYKNNEVVGIETDSENYVGNGKKFTMSFDYPYDYNSYKEIKFDDYKVFVIEAYED